MNVSGSTKPGEGATITRVLSRLKDEPPRRRVTPKPETRPTTRVLTHEVDPSKAWPLPGLAPMTRVRTSFGDVHAVALRLGDQVRLANGSFKPIVWLKRLQLDADFLGNVLDAHPIRLKKDSLGPGLPSSEIMLSPRQIINARQSNRAGLPREASELVSRPGVYRHRETGLSYTMFHVGEPAEVVCEGLLLRLDLPEALPE